jgi:hypothetical protein
MIWFARVLMEGEQMTQAEGNGAGVRRLPVPGAIEHLLHKHGVQVTESALAQHRYNRTGPEYTIILRRVYYTPAALDAWIEKKVAESLDSQARAASAQL